MKKVMPFLLGLCLILSSFITCPVLAEDSQMTEDTAESEEESTQEIQETESSIEIISDIQTEDSSSEESVFDEENEEESSVEEEPAEEESIPQEQQDEISEEEMQPETTEEESEILPEEPSEEESEEEVSEETPEEESEEEEVSEEENPEEEDSEEEESEEESEEEDSGKTVYSPSDWLKELLNNPVIERMAVQGRTYESEINNFPADYKALLEQMHASHPNWVFVADYNGIDFATAVQAEATGDRSQIPVLCSDLIKSNTGNNYYPEYGTYRIVDGSGNNGWVNANEAIITYFMDPRNFLNDKYIWQFETYSYDAGTQKESTVRQIWPGPTFDGVSYTTFTVDNDGTEEEVSYSYVITQAGKTTGVSPVWLASKIRQEVGLGSGSITGTYTTDTGIKYNGVVDLDGYFNYYNIGAYAGATPIANGLFFAAGNPTVDDEGVNIPTVTSYERAWISPDRAILGGAQYIAANYLNRGQNTGYLSRFNVTSNNTYNHQYMGNLSGAATEGYSTYTAYTSMGILNASRLFYIPIFNNMPSLTEKPSISGTTGKATVTSSSLTIRNTPSISGSSLGSFPSGTTVNILGGYLDTTQSASMYNMERNPYWFQVSGVANGKTYTGYVSADFLQMTAARNLTAGSTTQLYLSNSVSQTVYYQSGNPWIATVDQNGKVTALHDGLVNIYCFTATGVDAIGIQVTGGSSSPAVSINSSGITVSPIGSKTFTSQQIKPSVTVKNGSKTLVNGTDYTLSYSNNVLPGTATITINGIGAYSGSRTVTFTINGTYSQYVTTANLNYRKGPGFAYTTVGTAAYGTQVDVLNGYSFDADYNTWVIVKINGSHYYMSTAYLSLVKRTAGWFKNSNGWWYMNNDGSYPKSQWQKIDGYWYYFDSRGYMMTGWQQIGGSWYYLKSSGALAVSQWVDGKYYVDSSGKWIPSYTGTAQWVKGSGGWWYRRADGSYPKSQWMKIGGYWYHFDSSGYMQTGWIKVSGKWYYLNSSGRMVSSRWVGSYYLKADGSMATFTTYTTTANLRYRDQPGFSGSTVDILEKGTKVQVYDGWQKSSDGYVWYCIAINQKFYYVASEYLTR